MSKKTTKQITNGMLLLVRHGETRLTGTYCGSTSPSLSRRGIAQARSAARLLAQYPIDRCYFSPLLRAKQTAAIIHRRIPVVFTRHSSLREIHFGDWEGLRFQDIKRKWPALARRWVQHPSSVRIPRAETVGSLRKRIKRFLGLLGRRFSNRNVLIVAHGGSLSTIVLERLKLPNKEFMKYIQPPGSIRMIQGRTVKWIRPC
jgi:broad specificity phosphatase PhoE